MKRDLFINILFNISHPDICTGVFDFLYGKLIQNNTIYQNFILFLSR